jgi:hypothetical protein
MEGPNQELPVAAMFVNGSGQHVQSLERTAHRCFLPSFGAFGHNIHGRHRRLVSDWLILKILLFCNRLAK